MLDRELANRLVTYADAVVALVFVSVSAFALAVADPDIRCNLAEGKVTAIIISLLTGILFSILLLLLRRWELDLRAEDSVSSKGRRYSRYLNVGRFLIIWFSVAMTSLLLSSIDQTGCAV